MAKKHMCKPQQKHFNKALPARESVVVVVVLPPCPAVSFKNAVTSQLETKVKVHYAGLSGSKYGNY